MPSTERNDGNNTGISKKITDREQNKQDQQQRNKGGEREAKNPTRGTNTATEKVNKPGPQNTTKKSAEDTTTQGQK